LEIVVSAGFFVVGRRGFADWDSAWRCAFTADGDGDILFRNQVDRFDFVAFFLGVMESLAEIVELAAMVVEAESSGDS
jgi:hypothetical protein